jgi:hypothetical protein
MSKLTVIGAIILFLFGNAIAHESIIDLTKKFYVKAEQINFSENKIYIDVEGIIYETPAIYSDEDGYFIDKIAKSGDCSWYEWECSKCRFCNLRGVDYECRNCKRPISQ